MNPARLPEPAASWAAEFTTQPLANVQCQRPTCGTIVTAMKDLYYMQDLRQREAGRYLCKGCYDYYLSKTTSQRTATRIQHPTATPDALSAAHQANIKRDIAAAQRGSQYFLSLFRESDPYAFSL
jgi:hypothetical protein